MSPARTKTTETPRVAEAAEHPRPDFTRGVSTTSSQTPGAFHIRYPATSSYWQTCHLKTESVPAASLLSAILTNIVQAVGSIHVTTVLIQYQHSTVFVDGFWISVPLLFRTDLSGDS
jgi:uncharacterized surface protein with fasciclin (FAS1) repeats